MTENMKTKMITWSSRLVDLKDIKPTPNNYKIQTDLGRERLQQSLRQFGLAGTVVVNTDLVLIDGNSRIIEAKQKGMKKIWASMPDRKLTTREFNEMAALFDFAIAGEVDTERIKKDLGSSADFYRRWGFELPMELLEGMGAQSLNGLEFPKAPTKDDQVSDVKMVSLFFSDKQEKLFRIWEAAFKKKYKTESTTDTVFKALQVLAKQLNIK
jgi:hypothetical protein